MENSQTARSREYYMITRALTGSPPVQHTKLSEDTRVLSIKGTDYEKTIDMNGYVNLWEAKAQLILQWSESLKEGGEDF